MNFHYDLDRETGMMRLKFKEYILDSMPSHTQTAFKDCVLPILQMNDKLVLTGSLSLKLLGFEPLDEIGDYDFGLLDTFTEEDYNNLKNFFNLRETIYGAKYVIEDETKDSKKFDPKAHLWQLHKEIINEHNELNLFKLDIFNDEILRKRDIITIYWGDFEVKLVHPSVTLSYRMRYALDIRSSNTFKYWERMKAFMDNAKPYYEHLRKVSKMIERINEYNTNIEGDKRKIEYVRDLIRSREINCEKFLESVFDKTTVDNNLNIEVMQFRVNSVTNKNTNHGI